MAHAEFGFSYYNNYVVMGVIASTTDLSASLPVALQTCRRAISEFKFRLIYC